MISVDEALSLIKNHVHPLSAVTVPVSEALNSVLSKSIRSSIDMPPFHQSAMDGYAVNGVDLNTFEVVGEIQAGDDASGIELKKGEAVRIFTGAMVPESATTVIKQEITVRSGSTVDITEAVREGMNIRYKGEQIQSGDIALEKHTCLNPGAIGFLTMLGIQNVSIYKTPEVSIVVTGNELMHPGAPLKNGKIYESNSQMLFAALKSLGVHATILRVKDDYAATKNTLREALSTSDLLLTTGGISVGDYDFVGKALSELGVEELFYKVRHKPGKPLYFGKTNSTIVFGLPGNPASVLSCFYMYVVPALLLQKGNTNPQLEQRTLTLENEYSKTAKMAHFLKARASNGSVSILNAQSSAMLSSFAQTNCLAYFPEGKESWEKGDSIDVFMLN